MRWEACGEKWQRRGGVRDRWACQRPAVVRRGGAALYLAAWSQPPPQTKAQTGAGCWSGRDAPVTRTRAEGNAHRENTTGGVLFC